MNILFVGYSNLIKKRILPILQTIPEITHFEIAKYLFQEWDYEHLSQVVPFKLYDNYNDAVENSNADIVYISTTNNSHFELAKASLNKGKHTIIDKPATLSLEDTQELIQIAKAKRLLLSESVVYLYHPQFQQIKSIFTEKKSTPKFITAHFSFPPLNKDNFRYVKELGGGAFNDTSSYVVSIGRFVFDSLPEKAFYIENEKNEDGLEISYSLLLQYPDGKSLIGHFGFNTEYINSINILSEKLNMYIDRVFTIPDDISNKIHVKENNKIYIAETQKGNTFELYLKHIIKCIVSRKHEHLYNDMLLDATARFLIEKNK